MPTKTGSYLDSLRVDQEESHALEEDVKEEGGVTEEGVDQLGVGLRRPQDVGQLLGQLLVNCALIAAFGHCRGAEHVLRQTSAELNLADRNAEFNLWKTERIHQTKKGKTSLC